MGEAERKETGPTGRIPGLAQVPVIGILRGCPPERVEEVAEAALEAGLRVLEVTFDSPDAFEQIRRLAQALPDASIGAGTVLGVGEVAEAVEAGARFVVTPVLDEPVVTACVQRDLPCIPGAATPSEIWRALQMGATAVKVFPAAQLGGPAYLSALRAPLGSPPLVPTGGVGPEEAPAYLEAGAVAVAMGSGIFPRRAMEAGDLEAIGRAARAAVEAVG